jgi:nucleoside-diphosphate-sugar epimerase
MVLPLKTKKRLAKMVKETKKSKSVSKKRILLTGAAGFIGSHVLQKLVEEDQYNIRVLVRNPKKLIQTDQIEVVHCDLLEKAVAEREMCGVDIVVHLAATIKGLTQKHIYTVNLQGTKNLLDACKKQKKKPHFIFISSDLVLYKNQSAYGNSKKDAEKLVREYSSYTIIRPSVVYGPGDKINLGKIISFVAKHHFLFIPGDGKALFQPIYVTDVAKYISLSIEAGKKLHQKTFVLAGKDALSFNAFIHFVARKLQKRVTLIHVPYLFSFYVVSLLEKIIPKFPVRSSQIYNLNTMHEYNTKRTRKYLNHVSLSVEEGLDILFSQRKNGRDRKR